MTGADEKASRFRPRRAPFVFGIAAMLGVGAFVGPVRGESSCEPASIAGDPGCAGADTLATPVARHSANWRQVGGAPFRRGGEGTADTVIGSPTDIGADLFAVDFRDASAGLAGGATCAQPPADGLSGPELDEHLTRCRRVPVVYRHGDTAGRSRWEETRLGERSGYVASIAWLGPDRALAVGGDGTPSPTCPGCGYPRREDGRDVTAPGYVDPAGQARAWLYEGGRWTEIEGLPYRMSALTAVDCRESDGWCVAGGLGQLWSWRDGRFEKGFGAGLPGKVNGTSSFRVRDLRLIAPGRSKDPVPIVYPEGYAVTAGCCGPTPDANVPAALAYDAASDSWAAQPALTAAAQGLDSLYGVTVGRTSASNTRPMPGVILSPGGPARAVEPPSATNTLNYQGASNLPSEASWLPLAVANGDRSLSSIRLVSGDGASTAAGANAQPPDLAVGELRSTGRAVAYDRLAPTPPKGYDLGDPLSGRLPSADAEQVAASQRSYKLVALPSYPLNAVDLVDPTAVGGVAWAVGDRGAIVKRSPIPEEEIGLPARAPLLGASRPARLPDDSPYAEFRPVGGAQASEVPPLATRPEYGEGWGFEAWGSPGAAQDGERVTSIAMSRDGSEGWAVGPAPAGGLLALYRFDGTAWRRCDGEACAGLAELRSRGLTLESIAAVDPSSNRLEAVAVGWLPKQADQQLTAVIIRYRDGRWTVEDAPADPVVGRSYRLRSVAFTAPDDGWAYGQSATDKRDAVMLHFSDGRWTVCAGAGACDDDASLLPDRRFLPPAYGPVLIAAGDRVFLTGTRMIGDDQLSYAYYPVILSRQRGGRWGATDGLDPARSGRSPGTSEQGRITSFAVTAADGGHTEGWARMGSARGDPSNATLRLAPGRGWEPWSPAERTDALRDRPAGAELRAIVPAGDGEAQAVMTTADGPLLRFDAAEGRWRALAVPFDPSGANPSTAGDFQALEPDGRRGLWLVHDRDGRGPFFHRYTDRRHRAVFDDVPQPFTGSRIRHLAAGGDGTVWLAGDGGALARYDRLTGWSRLEVPGWDRDGVAPAAVTAIAAAPDGTGVAVGEGGRIADLTSLSARLDAAAGRLCSATGGPPCGTGETLRAVDIAPDGSAMTGGDHATLLWRAAHQEFRTIPAPPIDPSTRITGVSLPASDRAWIATALGEVFAGHREGSEWTWGQTPENVSPGGDPLSTEGGSALGLRAIAIDAGGRGYAVGDNGVVLERTGAGTHPWRRLPLSVNGDFTAVALPRGGGNGALIGGDDGAVWTRSGGRFQLARPASVVDGYAAGGGTRVSGLALLPGDEVGETEAWASLDGPGLGGALLHYVSDTGDPLLTPVKPALPLPDAPASRANELSFVAFGKSDCANGSADPCPGPSGTDSLSDLVSRRIVEALDAEGRKPGDPRFAVFTGDAHDHGGAMTGVSRPAVLNEWVDLVARPLDEAGVPALGAIGVLDLSEAASCMRVSGELCVSSTQVTHAGANALWRQAMADRVGQDHAPQTFGGLRYRPVRDDLVSPTKDVELPAGAPDPVPSSLPTGGARTHYAVDVLQGQRPLARLVFTDNSLGSLRASDPLQQPPEPRGQLAWLDRVLGSRPRGLPAVVVSTAPSYSYRPETVAGTADDGASFEEVVLKHGVSAVVSGRLGWNALYYTLAPGLHCPGPGGSYPERPPSSPADCGRATRLPDPGTPASREVADALQGVEAPAPPTTGGLGPAVPFAIASSAGGKLAQTSGEGYWHGYSKVRLDASGDPAKTIVEQRPILDWLVITASERRLRPGDRVTLRGVGREPPAADTPPAYHRLTGPSITHRYDLVVADPRRPWLPYRDADGGYVALSDRHPNCSVACVDDQTGAVSTGAGASHRVYAIGLLSAGELTATYPLAFEPGRRSGSAGPARAAAPRSVPGAGRPSAPAPAPSASAATMGASTAELPTFPPFSPPAPPADVHPPGAPAPPGHTTSPPPVTGSGTGSEAIPLVPPEPPRVTPLPPDGPTVHPAPKVTPQREEAARRQPAVVEFEDDSPLAADEALDAADDIPWVVDLALEPTVPRGAEATRRTDRRADLHMTAAQAGEQPSAWTRGALYGGGLTLTAFVLASGWMAVRPRRRRGIAPAAAPAAGERPWRRR